MVGIRLDIGKPTGLQEKFSHEFRLLFIGQFVSRQLVRFHPGQVTRMF
jgi:hypothetical protein